jgi:uncharacterized lipoprotein
MKLLVLCTTAVVIFSGCAWVRQTATLKLEPIIEASSIGKDVTVAVRVVDRRSSTVIGHRGVDSKNAAIKTDQNVPELFREKIQEGLGRKGFTAQKYDGQPGRLLTVEIRRLVYTTDMEYWKGIVEVEAELLAFTVKDGVKFEQFYRGQRKETTVEAPRASTNERLINGAISDAVQRLFEDERLLRYLAE